LDLLLGQDLRSAFDAELLRLFGNFVVQQCSNLGIATRDDGVDRTTVPELAALASCAPDWLKTEDPLDVDVLKERLKRLCDSGHDLRRAAMSLEEAGHLSSLYDEAINGVSQAFNYQSSTPGSDAALLPAKLDAEKVVFIGCTVSDGSQVNGAEVVLDPQDLVWPLMPRQRRSYIGCSAYGTGHQVNGTFVHFKKNLA
jgi:hypothetical protein